MNKKITILILLAFVYLGVPIANARQEITNPHFPRKALVAPDCMVNSLINVVGVASGTSDLNNLLDENIDNYATLGGLAGVGLLADPIIRVKDRKNLYPAGTVAGFCIQDEAGSTLLSLNVLKTLSIGLYKGGTLIKTLPVEQTQGGALSLDLIQISSSSQVSSFLTVTSTDAFDEIGLFCNGVNLDALKTMKVKYAFVGDAQDMPLITDNVPGIKAEIKNGLISISTDNLTDSNTENSVSVPVIVVDAGVTVTLSWTNEFKKGSKIGFKFSDSNLLNLGLANKVSIKLTDSKENTSTTVINTTVLGLSLIGTEQKNVSILATQDFNKAELIISALGASASARNFYYGYIQEPTEVAHHHDLGLSADAAICDSETDYQLTAKESVTWAITEKPAGDNTVKLDSSTGKVTGMSAGSGVYKFTATASDGCTGTVTITKGITRTIDPGCDQAISATSLALSDDTHGITGSLLSISDLKNEGNIIDNSLYTYAEYTGGLGVAENLEITGIKRTDGGSWSSGESGSRVGFVVETSQTLLNADALNFLRVRLYDSNTSTWVIRDGVINKTDVVSAALIGSDKSVKVRYSIDVPAGISFDEVTLWKSGVLSLNLSSMRIYGAFIEDNSLNCYADDPLGCGGTIISTETTDASINYDATGITGLVSAAAVMSGLENLIDEDMSTYAYTTGVEVASKTCFAVRLGREYNSTHQVGIVIDNTTYLAGVGLADWMTVETYYRGSSTGDKQTNWEVLGVNAIGYGDKTYLMLNPISPYDEIRITITGVAGVLDDMKLYGVFVRSDADADGVPDCRDENSCPSDNTGLADVALASSRICRGDYLTISGKGTPGTTYLLRCLAQGIDGRQVEIGSSSDATGSTSFEWTCGPMPNVGHYSLVIIDEHGRVVANPTFTVHPSSTTWKQSPVDSDWNNWENWTEGSPLACTNVTIPSGCVIYPLLTSTEAGANGCDAIHFESGAEVVKTHLLHYRTASVDLTIEPDRYYMLSAPLKDMVTGDMFVPAGGNPEAFTQADATTAPQNRFNPRVYQRIWANNAKGQTLTNNQVIVTPDETQWTPPFNALAETYGMGKGFSLKAVRGTATAPITFRFPKLHDEYEYVTGDNVPTGIKETINRAKPGRFIYENEGNTATFPVSVTLTNQQPGTVFLAGNPFMSHIDVNKFLAGNTGITSVKVYDGNTTNSMILADGDLLSGEASGYSQIAPMQSFFVTVDTEASEQAIQYTEDMLVSAPGSLLKSTRSLRADDPAKLYLTAHGSGCEAGALLRFTPSASAGYLAGEDAEILVDSEVRPVIAIFSIAGGKALDIQQLDEATEIPLGFYLRSPADVTLSVRKAETGQWNGWQLFDAENGQTFPLDGGEAVIKLGILSTNTGRFFLRNGIATSNDGIKAADRHVYCFRQGASSVIVRSTSGEMERCEIYSADGKPVDNVSHAASEYRMRLSPGVNLIRAYLPGMPVQVMKILCY